MVQIIEENRQPGYGQRVASGLMDVIGRFGQQFAQKQERERMQAGENKFFKENYNQDIGSIENPELRKELFKNALNLEQLKTEMGLKQDAESYKKSLESQKNLQQFQGALQRVNRMRQIRQGGNLGWGASFQNIPGSDTARDIGEYETLGNSLISFASSIPIRNKNEFETLTGMLNDPFISDAQAEGVLNAMERIISDSMREIQYGVTPQNKPMSAMEQMLTPNEPRPLKKSVNSFVVK